MLKETETLICLCPFCGNWYEGVNMIDHLVFVHEYPTDSTVKYVKKRLAAVGGMETKIIEKDRVDEFVEKGYLVR